VVSFTARSLYPRYPFYRRLDEPQSRSGRLDKTKFLTLPGVELGLLGLYTRTENIMTTGKDGKGHNPSLMFLSPYRERPSIGINMLQKIVVSCSWPFTASLCCPDFPDTCRPASPALSCFYILWHLTVDINFIPV
jgi:hypothetical protein